ncbi:MAG TPA: paraquat-inducible protein A [Candidatus Binatia bacterium]
MFQQPISDASLVACSQCDVVQKVPVSEPGCAARCLRCGHELRHFRRDSLNRTLALTVAAAILYVIANTTPMLGLTVAGHQAFTTVFGGALELWDDGEKIVAMLVLMAAVVSPALQILFMLVITTASMRERMPYWVGTLLRYHPMTRTWSMIEVMLLGVLVALIKIAELAHVIPGAALFALGFLVVVFAAMHSVFDPHEIWERVEWASERADHPAHRHPAAEQHA